LYKTFKFFKILFAIFSEFLLLEQEHTSSRAEKTMPIITSFVSRQGREIEIAHVLGEAGLATNGRHRGCVWLLVESFLPVREKKIARSVVHCEKDSPKAALSLYEFGRCWRVNLFSCSVGLV
jgi:hypothetical protein